MTLSHTDVDMNGPSLRRAVSEIPTIEHTPLFAYFKGLALRATTRTFSHPFLVVAVRMVTHPESKPFPFPGYNRGLSWALYSTWMKAAWDYYSDAGTLGCFFRGLRSSFTAAVFPFSPFLLAGVAEMVVYRRILGQAGSGSSIVLADGVVKASTPSASIISDIISDEGGYSAILRYGHLTLLQVIPGFISFVASRTALWFVLGPTKRRQKQRKRRMRRLRHFWGTYVDPTSTKQATHGFGRTSDAQLSHEESTLTDPELEEEEEIALARTQPPPSQAALTTDTSVGIGDGEGDDGDGYGMTGLEV